MGNVQQKKGFVDDPFFNRTLYPVENVGGVAALSRVNGSGSAITAPLPSDLQQYQYIAVNNEGSNSRFVYGVGADGNETSLGIYNVPFTRIGIQIVGETKLDNANQFTLQNTENDKLLIFSNSTLPAGSTVNFTARQGDYAVVTCYCTGTLISTTRGEVAVEDLCVGDFAVTASGEHRPIRWIGSRTLDPRRTGAPGEAMPVRIRAGALGENRPGRDLVVSPGHAIAVDVLGEVLIPASVLVNGATIVQEDVESVTYWHIELDSHDILIAEGQPAESYLDMGNRGFFSEAGVVSLAAQPDADATLRTHADFCRPFHDGGAVVEAVRAQARVRAEASGWTLSASETWAGVHLEVDGRIVRPEDHGLSARFMLPADARDVWLVSPVSVPSQVGQGADNRTLGLCLSGLSLSDGRGEVRAVTLDDALLCVGFHTMSPGHRWTAGRARLPAALLAGMEGEVSLDLALALPALPRWVAPQAAETGPIGIAA